MSELIDWNALTPAQRNALIAEKVMGWTSQLCDKREPLVYYDSGDAECPRCGAYGFGTSFKHGIIPPPRYSESMDAAWFVVRAINKPVDGSHERYARFIDALEKIVGSPMFFDLFYCDPESDDQHLTPERICDAALQAIEPEKYDVEVPDPGAIDTYIDGLKQVQRLAEMIEEQGTIEGTKELQRLQWLAERIEKRREQP